MPYLEQDEFERRLNLARERGANDQQVEALRVKYKPMVKPKDNLVVGAVKSMVKPLTDAGRDAIGGLYGAGAATLEMGQRLAFDPQNKSKTFDREIQRGLNFATPRGRAAMLDQSTVPTKQVGLGVQRGAGVGSFLVPGGKTIGAAAKFGAAGGALYGASQGDNISLRNIASGAGGGAIGGAGAKALTRGVQIAGKTATDALPKKIMNSVFREPLKDTRAAVKSGTKTLGEMALEKGEKGLSDEKIYQNAVTRINQFEDELTGKLASSKRIVPVAAIRETVEPLVKKYEAAGNFADAQAILDRVDGIEKFHGKSLPVAVANEVKRTLYDEARKGYGTKSSESVEGIKAIARGLKEAIGSKVDGADEINKQLSYNGRIADSLVDRMSREGRNKMFGLTDTIMAAPALVAGPTALLPVAAKKILESTAGATTISNALSSTGKLANPVSGRVAQSRIPSYMGSNIGSRIGVGVGGIENLSSPEYQRGRYSSSTGEPNPFINGNKPQGENPYQQPYNQAYDSPSGSVKDNLPENLGTGQPDYYNKPKDQPKNLGVNMNIHGGNINPSAQPVKPQVLYPSDVPNMLAQGVDLKKHWVVSPDGTKIWNPYAQKAMPYNKDVWQKKAPTIAQSNAESGLRAIADAKSKLINPDGTINRGVLNRSILPAGGGNTDAQVYETAVLEIQDVLQRLRTGAAIGEKEYEFYSKKLPRITDGDETIAYKLNAFEDLFARMGTLQ